MSGMVLGVRCYSGRGGIVRRGCFCVCGFYRIVRRGLGILGSYLSEMKRNEDFNVFN